MSKKEAETMALLFSVDSNNRGIAIVAVTLVLVVVALLGGAIISQTNHDTQLSNRVYKDKQAVYFAESAKERGYQEILDDPNFTTLADSGRLWDEPMPGGTYDLIALTLQEDPQIVAFTATGSTDSGDTREIDVVAEVIKENVCVWNNAIFGGSGQVGGVIKGNAAIHGSVHLLGEDVGAGNNSIEALDLIGNSLVHNNYIGMPAALAAKVPALPTTVFGGETIATIDAKLRVKNGAVGVSGSAEIGEMNIVGNVLKETLDGIYIETDAAETRWTGNQVVGGVPNPGSVQSDNGTNALYDLGDAVTLPQLSEPYDDPISGVTFGTYEAYFDAKALHLPAMEFDDSTDAADAILAYQALGEFSDGEVVTVNPATGVFTIQYTNADGITNSIAYNPNAAAGVATLGVSGMVQFDGDLIIGEKSLEIAYAGKGTMFAAGDGGADVGNIDVHSNVLPAGQFPTVSVFGFMAKNDINLADGPGDSNLMMAGAFFAGNQILSTKQNEILGTFVCNYFDMGTNVPKIYQVPALKDNLPPGLIGSEPVWVVTGFEEKSWQIEIPPTAYQTGGY